jgi:hypothetical protein
MGAFGKSLRKSDLNHESSKLLIRWLKSTTEIQTATIHTKKRNKKHRFLNIQAELPGHKLPWFESNWNWLERKESKQPEHTVTSGGPDRAHQKNDSFDER